MSAAGYVHCCLSVGVQVLISHLSPRVIHKPGKIGLPLLPSGPYLVGMLRHYLLDWVPFKVWSEEKQVLIVLPILYVLATQ